MTVLSFSRHVLILANRASRSLFKDAVAIVLAAVMVVFLHPSIADAQGSRVAATLQGTVKDSSGAVIPGAAVLVRNTSTNQARTLETDADGSFHAEELAVSSYEVRIDQPGFAPYRSAEIDLSLGQTMRLDIVLVPASSIEKITVNA